MWKRQGRGWWTLTTLEMWKGPGLLISKSHEGLIGVLELRLVNYSRHIMGVLLESVRSRATRCISMRHIFGSTPSI